MPTLYLHDDGEESWQEKYHLGCGGVYLEGYKNYDTLGVLAKDHPELVEKNKTTIRDYYARLDGGMHSLPQRRETVCDVVDDISRLVSVPRTVDKIVAVQVFEHLSPIAAIRALRHWHSALKIGGVLLMSVPDMDGTLAIIENGDVDFALRHLRGRQGDKWNSHHAWYTKDTLIELVEFMDFDRVMLLPNFHFYPAIVIKAYK